MGVNKKNGTQADLTLVPVTDLETAIKQFEAVKSTLIQASKNIHNKNLKLIEEWEGDGGDAFMKASFSIESDISDMISTIKNAIEGIHGTKNDAVATDEFSADLLSKS